MMIDRGIITTSQEIVCDGNEMNFKGHISPELLRYYILYWDKVVLTDSDFFPYELNSELKQLQSANIVAKKTAKVSIEGAIAGSELVQKHFESLAIVAKELNDKNAGQWTIHQTGNKLILPDHLSEEIVSADISLNNCLPVPRKDIPLDKILDFKLNRSDQLEELRLILDELYLSVVSAGDIPRARIVQITRLNNAIKGLNQVFKESFKDTFLASRKISLNFDYNSIVKTPIKAGLIVGATFSSPILGVAAALAAGTVNSIKFETTLSKQHTYANEKQLKLSYLASLKSEGFI